MRIRLHPKIPFNLTLNLRDVTRKPFGLTETVENHRFRTIILDRPVTVTQDAAGDITVEVQETDPQTSRQIRRELERILGLRQDLQGFYRFLNKDRHLQPLARKLRGLTILQKSSPFEALVMAIVDQQLTVSFAARLKERLITTFGEKRKFDRTPLWTFPRPESLARLPEDALRPYKFSLAKSRAIVELARGVVSGKYPLWNWTALDDDDLIRALTSIYGVGRWTAEYAAMVGYARCDVIPAADIGLQRAVKRCYRLKERPDESQVRKMAQSWRPWRGLVTYYLWHAFE